MGKSLNREGREATRSIFPVVYIRDSDVSCFPGDLGTLVVMAGCVVGGLNG